MIEVRRLPNVQNLSAKEFQKSQNPSVTVNLCSDLFRYFLLLEFILRISYCSSRKHQSMKINWLSRNIL